MQKTTKNRETRTTLRHIAVLCFVFALALVILAVKGTDNRILQAILIVATAFPVGFGIRLFRFLALTRPINGNFFLYDRKTNKDISVEDLNAEEISRRLQLYMLFFRRGKQLNLADLFEGNAPEKFKPLFCYALLEILTASENDAQWSAFLSCGQELALAFEAHFAKAEPELTQEIQKHIHAFDGNDPTSFRTYLSSKSNDLAVRMLSYVKEHIHDFD